MSRIAPRLRRLEQEMGAAFVCPICEDRGVLEVVIDDPRDLPPEPKGCRRCGKISILIRLVEAKRPRPS